MFQLLVKSKKVIIVLEFATCSLDAACNVHITDTPHPSHCWDTICCLTWPSCWRSFIIHYQVVIKMSHLLWLVLQNSCLIIAVASSSLLLPPAHYEQFKKTLHGLFPVIVDTKNLCHGLRKVIHSPSHL